MKLINNILCFLSVLVLCVPLLCFNVGADDSDTLAVEQKFFTGFTDSFSDIEVSYVDSDETTFESYYPYFSFISSDNKKYTYDLSNISSAFKSLFPRIYIEFQESINSETELYYIYRYYTYEYSSNYIMHVPVLYFSFSPISFNADNSLFSESTIYISYHRVREPLLEGEQYRTQSSNYIFGYQGRSIITYTDNQSVNQIFTDYSDFYASETKPCTYIAFYSNCITEYNGNKVSERPKSELSQYPVYRNNYIKAFDKMLLNISPDKVSTWKTGFDVYKWWVGDDPNQLSLFGNDFI